MATGGTQAAPSAPRKTKKKNQAIPTGKLPRRMGVRGWGPTFLRVLAQTCNVSGACRLAGINRRTAYAAREAHEEFAEQWDEAIEQAKGMLLTEAHNRIFNGTTETHRDADGNVVRTIHKYSDTMLIFMMKGYFPEMFRQQNVDVHHDGTVKHTYIDGVEFNFVEPAKIIDGTAVHASAEEETTEGVGGATAS